MMYFMIFLVTMFGGLAVVFALLFGPGLAFVIDGKMMFIKLLYSRLFNGVYSPPLLALPFFIVAGEIMNQGGITKNLVKLAQAFLGHRRGGLAQVNIASSMLFAGLSGSAVADTSALGSMLIPAMERNGYTRRFAAAVTAASSVIGPIIPPSGLMILYAFVMNVSVAGLFAAGLVPGIAIGVGLMLLTSYLAKVRSFPVANEPMPWSERGKALWDGIIPMMTPVIMLGGILAGIFTPTEAAAVGAGYALIVALATRQMSFKDIPRVFTSAAISSGVILMLVGAAVSFASIVSFYHTPEKMAKLVLSVSENPYAVFFMVNILLFIVGMFLDAGPAILILGPILGPAMVQVGIHPLHFAVVMCVNVTVGLATPPMGLVLFVAAGLSRESLEKIAIEMIPFLLVEFLVIFLISYFPILTLSIPNWLGYLDVPAAASWILGGVGG
ncbi:MAG: TRAP transporter large permease [Desulfofustis sp.]|jgi:tripartite ATP-independent transporter DctM subunit